MYQPSFLGETLASERIEITAVDFTEKTCARCKREMVKLASWQALSVEERKILKKDFAPQCSRGLCRSCYNHLHKVHPEVILDFPRNYATTAEFVEDLKIYLRRTHNKKELARLSGMSVATYEKALTRAKKAGLL